MSARRPSTVHVEPIALPGEPGEPELQGQRSRPEALEIIDLPAAFHEGGYGWVVTASGFILLFLALGISYSWGVFQAQLVQEEIGSTLALSAIGAVSAFSIGFGCLPASWILARYGPQKTALAGVTLVAAGLLLSGFATNSLVGLMFTFGIMFGGGCGLVFMPAYTMPSQWFSKLRGLSTGLVSCGAGIGGAIFSIANANLIEAWGMSWTFRFLGFLTAGIGLPAAWLLRPGYAGVAQTETTRRRPLVRSSRYIRILLTCFIASYPFFIPPFFIPQYSRSVGLSASTGALNAAMFNVSSAIGRILFGIVADKVLGNINAWSLSVLIIALSSLFVWPYAVVKGTILLFVIICGLGSGGYFTLQSSVVAQIVGDHQLNSAIGWVEVAQSLGYLAGPISAGALLDTFGGTDNGAGPYRPAIYLVGASTALAWTIIMSVRISSSKAILERV